MELPEEYKRGFKDFLGIKIDLSKRPLIPRPETEYWVQWFIKQDHKEKMKCLDLFSGSGCVGVAVLKNIQDSICHFGEIDDAFLEQIKINCSDIDSNRYKIIKTDIFQLILKVLSSDIHVFYYLIIFEHLLKKYLYNISLQLFLK
jgi:methylase of polypeptide subunit release factors